MYVFVMSVKHGKVCEPCEQLYDTLDALSECSCSLLLGSRVAIPLQDAVLKNDFGMDSIAWGFVDSPSLGHRHQGRSDVVEIFMWISAHGI